MEMEPEEEHEQRSDLKRQVESLRRQLESVRREHNLSDEQFEQFKNKVELDTLLDSERAKEIQKLLESEDRYGAILKILTHINERAVEVAEMLLDVTDDLRADVEALKQQKPFLTRLWSKKPGAKAS